jgi:hypothetical protein
MQCIPESSVRDRKYEIDRDHLIVPEFFVQSYDEKASDILRPAFDAIWQACGYRYSENYDEDGEWQKGT